VRQKATRINTDQNKNNQIFNITLINSRYFADNMNEEHVARFFALDTPEKPNNGASKLITQ
jgi:hypothetical protein